MKSREIQRARLRELEISGKSRTNDIKVFHLHVPSTIYTFIYIYRDNTLIVGLYRETRFRASKSVFAAL